MTTTFALLRYEWRRTYQPIRAWHLYKFAFIVYILVSIGILIHPPISYALDRYRFAIHQKKLAELERTGGDVDEYLDQYRRKNADWIMPKAEYKKIPPHHYGNPQFERSPSWADKTYYLWRDYKSYRLLIIFKRGQTPIVPTKEQIEKLYADKIDKKVLMGIIGYVPYRVPGDLVYYEWSSTVDYLEPEFTYNQVNTKSYIKARKAFYRTPDNNTPVLVCRYADDHPELFRHIRALSKPYWFSKVPDFARTEEFRDTFDGLPIGTLKKALETCPMTISEAP